MFEVNDRYPSHRLTIEGLEEIGHSFARTLVDFYDEPIARMRLAAMHQHLTRRAALITRRLNTAPHTPISIEEMINVGF